MKARRLVLCIFLSLALIVTFIPLTSYAAYGDEHAVTFNGMTDSGYVSDEDYYWCELEHGWIEGSGDFYDDYDENVVGYEGQVFRFNVFPDSGFSVASVQYSVNGGNKLNATGSGGDEYYFSMPAGDVTIWVSFVDNRIKNADITIQAPLCGTVISGNGWADSEDTKRQLPQPVVTIPTGVNYVLDGDAEVNYGRWYSDEKWFQGTMIGGQAYIANVDLRTINSALFSGSCIFHINGGQLINCENEGDFCRLTVLITAAHNYTHVVNKAGLLKNGSQYDQCVGCGVTQNYAVIPGWGKYYVKAPKAVAGKKSFTVKWGKQSKANLKKFTGYQVRYSMKKSMAKAKMVKVKKTATSKTFKKLKKKTKYYVQVRTYTKKSGKLFYSKWSPKKTVKTK